MRKSFLPLVSACVILIAIVTFVACTNVPDSGRKQFNLLSPGKEAALGFSEFEKIKKQRPISRDPQYNAMLQRVGARLSKVMPVPNAEWEFLVFEDDSPNAFALPGGKVGVHTGIFKITGNEAGLASVVGHEVAHVVARHSGERVSQGVVSAVAVAGASELIGRKTDSRGAQVAGTTALGGIAMLQNRAFSRQQELEADQLGALYMARAGYDPRESVELWKRFAAYKDQAGQGGGPAILSTHPVDEVRIRALEQFMPRALQEYRR
ncbi:MAG: M48 family metallopeptidase [Verrucomicrobiales bacterium]|nr:M48 family metallopeptidase [Verrucomicrobiales bacterium]